MKRLLILAAACVIVPLFALAASGSGGLSGGPRGGSGSGVVSGNIGVDIIDAGSLRVRGGSVFGASQDGGFVDTNNPTVLFVRGPGDTASWVFGPAPASVSTYDLALGYYSGSLTPIFTARGGVLDFNNTTLRPFTPDVANVGSTDHHWATVYANQLNLNGTNMTPIVAACHTDGGALAISNNTETRIDFSHCDSSTGVDNTAGSWTFTAPRAGIYQVSASINVDYASLSGGDTCPTTFASHRDIVYTKVNGATSSPFLYDQTLANACDNRVLDGTGYVKLAANDTLYVVFVQNTGNTRDLSADTRTRVLVQWISP